MKKRKKFKAWEIVCVGRSKVPRCGGRWWHLRAKADDCGQQGSQRAGILVVNTRELNCV